MEEALLAPSSSSANQRRGVASLGTTSFNMVNNMVGSGLLSIPWCVRQLGGSAPGAALLALIAFVTWSSFAIIGLVCSRVPGTRSFDDLAAVAGFSKRATKMLLALYTWLSCVSYVLLTCDFVAGHGGLARFDWACTRTSKCSWLITPFRHRYAVVLFLIVFVLYPFSRFKDFSSLKAISVVSLLAMIAMMIVALDTFFKEDKGDAESDSEFIKGFFLAHPIFLISFTAHYNAPKFYSELEEASPARFAKASAIAIVAAFIIYGFFGIISFETFEHATKSDVLENYSSTSGIAAFARFAMAIVVLTTYPLAFQALKGAVQTLVPQQHLNKLDYVLILVTSLPAALMRDIGVVLDYKGAVLGGIVALFIPALAYLRSDRAVIVRESLDAEVESTEEGEADASLVQEKVVSPRIFNIWSKILIGWALVASVGGFVVTTIKLVSDHTDDTSE